MWNPSVRSGKHTIRVQVGFLVAAAFLALGGWFASPRSADADIIILVDTANDVISNDGACSLREAITAANNNANYFGCIGNGGGYDLIEFSIGGGVPVINLASLPPTITDPIEINGAPNRVELRGFGLRLGSTATGSLITRMVIHNIGVEAANVTLKSNYVGTDASGMTALDGLTGVTVTGASVTIGGTNGTTPGGACTGDCNLISRTLYLGGSGALVQGNFLSTDVTGTSVLGTGNGLDINPQKSAMIGGDTPAARNVIGNGIYVIGAVGLLPAPGFTIKGNYIGVNSAGTGALDSTPIVPGIYIENVVNAPVYVINNVISRNLVGVDLVGAAGVRLFGNYIGTQANGISQLFNTGPGVQLRAHAFPGDGNGAHDNFIGGTQPGEGNVIAYNAGDGVLVDGRDDDITPPTIPPHTVSNRIRGNSTHDNAGLSIRLRDGGNLEVPAPMITQVTATSVSGTAACAGCDIDVYQHHGGGDGGETYLGSTLADGGGAWTMNVAPTAPWVSAAMTDATGNTSKFSIPYPCASDGLPDTDGDGLSDACDTDDDNDGVPDTIDSCRTLPEDFDGFQDGDGCPDSDNDVDGICDPSLASVSCAGSDSGKTCFDPAGTLSCPTQDCRNMAEDYDAFKDVDGCPEPDNDNDGFPDVTDACPGTDSLAGSNGMLGSPQDLNHNGISDGAEGPLTTDDSVLTFEDYDGVLDGDGCHDSPGDDFDGDGLTDDSEVFVYLTLPYNPDTDNDTVSDGADNCPLWANTLQTLPPWPVPAGDSDCDGFTNVAEGTLGTDPVDQCPDNAADDAWPPDINMTGGVSVTDVLFLKPWFGQSVPPAPGRYDIVPGGAINITDVVEFKKYFGLGCS